MGVSLTANEIVAYLKNSQLPTVLVEGKDDIIIYRNLNLNGYELLKSDCRNTLFEVFKQKHTIGTPTAFIADKDTFVYLNITSAYQGIIFTTGYCVENDLYEDTHEMIANLLDEAENQLFAICLDSAAAYCAFELKKLKTDSNYSPTYDISFVSTATLDGEGNFTDNFVKKYSFIIPDAADIEALRENKYRNTRGKYIFEIFEKIMQIRKNSQGKDSVFYTKKHLWDFAFKNNKILDNPNGKMASIQAQLLEKTK